MSDEVRRLLRLRVPVIAQLAARRMPVAAVRRISLAMIIEFDKRVEDRLDLLVNRQPMGRGEAVKVGEHFGLRVRQIESPAERVKRLGEQ